MKNRIFFFSLFLLFLFAATGCGAPLSASSSTSTIENPTACPDLQGISQAPEGKYFFVEIWVKREATGWGFSGATDRARNYIFDPVSRVLDTNYYRNDFDFTPTTWGFIGDGDSSHGDAGWGRRSVLALIQTFPYKTDIQVFNGKVEGYSENKILIPVELLAVTAEGVLLIEIEGRCMVLAPNESWSRVVEADVANEVKNGHLIITSSVTNYGWLEEANIIFFGLYQ
jgi:hypothetical protein